MNTSISKKMINLFPMDYLYSFQCLSTGIYRYCYRVLILVIGDNTEPLIQLDNALVKGIRALQKKNNRKYDQRNSYIIKNF